MTGKLTAEQMYKIIAELSKRDNLDEIKATFMRMMNDTSREDCTDAICYYSGDLAQAQIIHQFVNQAISFLRSKPETFEAWSVALDMIHEDAFKNLLFAARTPDSSASPIRSYIHQQKTAGIVKFIECVNAAIEKIKAWQV